MDISNQSEVAHTSCNYCWTSKDLNGKHLRIGSFLRPPFVTFKRGEDDRIDEIEGFCFEMVHTLMDLYNFTYTVISPVGLGTGTVAPNGTWNGIIGMLDRKELDIGIGPFSITHARAQVVDFTHAFYEEPTAIMIPPPSQKTRFFDCFRPFQFQVWTVLLCSLMVVPLIIWMIQFRQQYNYDIIRVKTIVLIKHYIWAYGVLTGQSGLGAFRLISISVTVLCMIWCLMVVVLIHAYIGTLMSFISFPKWDPVIFKLEDVPKSNLDWYVRRGTDLESLFLEAEGGTYKMIGDGLRKRTDSLTNDSNIGPIKVINGSSVYFTGKSYADFVIAEYLGNSTVNHDDQGCRLNVAKETFYKVNQAFALPKNSPLLSLFNRKMMQMMESGLTEYWRKKLWPKFPTNVECQAQSADGTNSGELRRLSLKDIQSPFFVLIIGAGLALSAFLLENIFYRFRY